MVAATQVWTGEGVDFSGLSRQILDVSLGVRKGERVWINGWDHTVDLVSALAEEARSRGCKVATTTQDEGAWLRSLKEGPDSSLGRLSQRQHELLKETDSYIFTLGPRHPVDWAILPRERRRLATIWLLEDNPFVREWRSIAKGLGIKILGIEATLATKERAKALGIGFEGYTESMYGGCLAGSEEMAERGKRLSSVLGTSGEVRIASPNGTSLEFALDDRPIDCSYGVVTSESRENARPVFLPAGAAGTTVDERSANGVIVYDRPIRRTGGDTENLRVEVADGKVVEYSASRRVESFRNHLKSGGEDSDRFAFVGFGLNPSLKAGYTQDDKVLGLVELNFGESRSRGGKNRGSGNFWGAVSRADVTVGGHLIMRAGRLLV